MPTETASREEIAVLANRAGLNLAPEHFDQLVEAYGFVEKMIAALARAHSYGDEPAHAFVPAKFDPAEG